MTARAGSRAVRRLTWLAGLTLASLAAAFALPRSGLDGDRDQVGEPVLPALAAEPESATRLIVADAGRRLTLERSADGTWLWLEAGGFPADAERVATALAGLSNLRLAVPLTQQPARYARLSLRDISDPASRALRVDVEAADAAPLGRLLIGRSPAGGGEAAIYVRRVFEARAWRALGEPAVPRDPWDWAERRIVDLAPARVRGVTVERTGVLPVQLQRPAADQPFLDGEEPLDPALGDALAGLARGLDWQVLQPLPDPVPPADLRVTLTTEDGLLLGLVLSIGEVAGEEAPSLWLRLDATTLPRATAAAAAEAAALDDSRGAWLYRIEPSRFTPLDALGP